MPNEKYAIVGAYLDIFEDKWSPEQLPFKFIAMLDKLLAIISVEDKTVANGGDWTHYSTLTDMREKFMRRFMKFDPLAKLRSQNLSCLHQNCLANDCDCKTNISRIFKFMIQSLEIEEVEKMSYANLYSFDIQRKYTQELIGQMFTKVHQNDKFKSKKSNQCQSPLCVQKLYQIKDLPEFLKYVRDNIKVNFETQIDQILKDATLKKDIESATTNVVLQANVCQISVIQNQKSQN